MSCRLFPTPIERSIIAQKEFFLIFKKLHWYIVTNGIVAILVRLITEK